MLVTLAMPGGIKDSNFGASNGVADALVYRLPLCSHRAEFIAKDIFRSMLKGTDIVVPGTLNKIFVHGFSKYLPYAAGATIAEVFWGPVPFSRRRYPALSSEDIPDELMDSFGFPTSTIASSRKSIERWWRQCINGRRTVWQWWSNIIMRFGMQTNIERTWNEESVGEDHDNADAPIVVDEFHVVDQIAIASQNSDESFYITDQ